MSTLKSKLSEKYGLVVEDQHIYFKDRKLRNEDQLKNVGVEAESKLVIHTAKTLEDMYQEKLRIDIFEIRFGARRKINYSELVRRRKIKD